MDFWLSPTINQPFPGNLWGWNSVSRLISTELEEIWRKNLGSPDPPPRLLLPSLNRVQTNNSSSSQPRRLIFCMQAYLSSKNKNFPSRLWIGFWPSHLTDHLCLGSEQCSCTPCSWANQVAVATIYFWSELCAWTALMRSKGIAEQTQMRSAWILKSCICS